MPHEAPHFTSEAGAYRDAEEGLRGRRGDLVAARRRELGALVPRAKRVYTRRVARQVFGAILAAGALYTCAGTALGLHGLTDTLVWIWGVALFGYVFARAFASARLERLLEERYVLSGDVYRDVDKLDRVTPLGVVRELAEPHEARSVWLPLVGVSLAAPLGIHLAVALMFSPRMRTFARFEEWVSVGTFLAGPALLVLCWCAVRFAAKLRARTLGELRYGQHAGGGWEAYGLTVAASAIWSIIYGGLRITLKLGPDEAIGIVGMGVASFVIVALTTLTFAPACFGLLRGRVGDERFALGVRA